MLGPLPSIGGFKSGSQLPTIEPQKPQSSLLAYTDSAKAKQSQLFQEVKADLANVEDDDEDEYEEEEEYDDDEFDANELLNLTDYQNKRKQ